MIVAASVSFIVAVKCEQDNNLPQNITSITDKLDTPWKWIRNNLGKEIILYILGDIPSRLLSTYLL